MPAKEIPSPAVWVSPLVVFLLYPTVRSAAIVCRFSSSVGKRPQNCRRLAGTSPANGVEAHLAARVEGRRQGIADLWSVHGGHRCSSKSSNCLSLKKNGSSSMVAQL